MNSALSELTAHWRPTAAIDHGISRILNRVAFHYGLSAKDLRSGSHRPEIAAARAMGFLLCRAHGYSYPAIGRAFDCHYTTAIIGAKKIENMIVRHKSVEADFEKLQGDTSV